MLVQEEEVATAGLELREEGEEFGRGEIAVGLAAMRGIGGVAGAGGLERRGGAQGNASAGEAFDAGEIFRIESEAVAGEFGELQGIFRVVRGEHPGGGPGGLGHGAAALEDNDTETAVRKLKGHGESDDSRSRDNDVCLVHWSIVGCVGA